MPFFVRSKNKTNHTFPPLSHASHFFLTVTHRNFHDASRTRRLFHTLLYQSTLYYLKTCVIVYKFFRLYVRRIRRISSSYKPCAKNYFQNQPKLSEFRRSHRAGFLDVRLACHFFTYPFLVCVPVSASRSSNSVIAKNSRTT